MRVILETQTHFQAILDGAPHIDVLADIDGRIYAAHDARAGSLWHCTPTPRVDDRPLRGDDARLDQVWYRAVRG